MATRYVRDDLMYEIYKTECDPAQFIQKAIEEKLERYHNEHEHE